MQRTPHRCPHCSQPLDLSRDMWGPYYLCADCGWTAEDDDQVITASPKPHHVPPGFFSAQPPTSQPTHARRV